MNVTNEENIKQWSQISPSVIKEIPEEGDESRQLLLNPIILELIGDVKNRVIFDAGCGNGYLSRMLAKEGAKVVGLEPSETLFQDCVEHEQAEPLGITYLQEDLSHPRTKLKNFDIVISNMVFMDIPDFQEAILTCTNALKPGGTFVFSLSHPCFPGWESDWRRLRHVEISEYFEETKVKATYGYNFFRPLSTYLNLLLDYGCAITRVIEPQFSRETLGKYPDKVSAKSSHVPQFIVIRAERLKSQ